MEQIHCEQILVVPREKLFDGRPIPHGFGSHDLKAIVKRIYQYGYFIDRPDAENNPGLKQIIPYMLLVCRDKYFLLQRTAGQTEKRLHHKYSIGVGGHINPVSNSPQRHSALCNAKSGTGAEHKENIAINGIIDAGLERELHEELAVSCPYKYEVVGYLNDDTNPVGQVHFGLVHKVSVDDEKGVCVAEKDLMTGRFATAKEIKQYYDKLETWSQIVYDALVKPQIHTDVHG